MNDGDLHAASPTGPPSTERTAVPFQTLIAEPERDWKMGKSLRSPDAEQAIELLRKAAHLVERRNHTTGRITLGVRLVDLPRLLTLVDGMNIEKETGRVPGMKGFRVHPWSLSATIEYEPSILPYDLWEDFCRVKEDPSEEDPLVNRLKEIFASEGDH